MISAKSFNHTLYSQLKVIITVQKYLSKLTNNNLEEIGTKILFLNEISKSQSGISILAHCFNDESDFHPKNIEILADLFIFLVEKSDPSNYFHLLKYFTVSCIRTREKVRSSFLFFLRTLMNRKVITIDLILQEISLMPPHSNKQMKKDQSGNNEFQIENENYIGKLENFTESQFLHKKFKIIEWFYPEIYKSNLRYIITLQNEHKYTIPDEFNTSDFNLILPIMNCGYSVDKLAEIIRNDDIDSFGQIVSQIGQSFDFNQTIKSTNFERCVLLKTDPTLIQYASFFGSVKIFKFLYLNKSDIEIVRKNMYTIAHFAISGGCSEIIHILAQNGVNFLSGFSISIQFFQNGIFQWLLENYAPKSEEDFELMNYYVCNIKLKRMYRRSYLISLNHKMDDTEYDYYRLKDYCNGKNDPIQKVVVRKSYPSQDSSDYSDSDVIVDVDKKDDDEENNKLNTSCIDNYFLFFDFDLLFESIVNSENYLSLFLLFDHGMSINACNKSSRKTLLHYAIQKGKTFLIDLLLSNDLIDVSIQDENDQTPIVYAVKYTRINAFFKMMKIQKVLETLNDHDYIQIAFYAKYLELNEISEYLANNWSINLKYLMEIDDIKTFCDAISYLPLNFLKENIKDFLIESFKTRNFEYFSILVNRILKDKDILLSATFYFVPKSQYKSIKDKERDFAALFQLLLYYKNMYKRKSFDNYYKLYLKNSNGKGAGRINYENMSQFEKEKHFYIKSDQDCVDIYLVKDPGDFQNNKIEIQFLT